jgi:hypothetical protein
MHDHEGHDLQIVVDANLADNIPVESFVQDSGAISASDEFSGDYFEPGTPPGGDSPA